jgi:hypothetical protein
MISPKRFLENSCFPVHGGKTLKGLMSLTQYTIAIDWQYDLDEDSSESDDDSDVDPLDKPINILQEFVKGSLCVIMQDSYAMWHSGCSLNLQRAIALVCTQNGNIIYGAWSCFTSLLADVHIMSLVSGIVFHFGSMLHCF